MNVIAPGSTRMVDLAQMAHAQDCMLVGRAGRLSMEQARDGVIRAGELVDAGNYEGGLEEMRAAKNKLGLGAA